MVQIVKRLKQIAIMLWGSKIPKKGDSMTKEELQAHLDALCRQNGFDYAKYLGTYNGDEIYKPEFNEEGEVASVFWNSIATVINAWMPYYEEGSVGYLILMSVTAIAGVLFTSVLIGIITSAIEERIGDLKKGNSRVLENGHTVVLGFYPGEYTLLRQLILAAGDDPACILVAEDTERDGMEQDISENLEYPKNVRIVCRTVDITDPASLEKCSLETAGAIIVNPTDDLRTLKTVLAVTALLDEKAIPTCA